MSEQTGTFYAVSVGPGDPELLTLQAVRVLENTPVIAAPQTASGQMLALDIARGAVDLTGKSVLPLRFTMSHDAAVRAESYRAAASAVEAELRQEETLRWSTSVTSPSSLRRITSSRRSSGTGFRPECSQA